MKPTPIRERVAAAVREYRAEANLSRARLGRLAGLSAQSIYNIEVCKHPCSIDHLEGLAKALRVPCSKLVEGVSP